ncbi:MAG: WG repeat-containing protein [Chitinophagaceae bacterium]
MNRIIFLLGLFCFFTQALCAQLTPFKDEATRLYGYKSPTGAIRISPRYNMANGFRSGMAAVNKGAVVTNVTANGGKWGYIDSTGNLVIPMIYDYVQDFKGDSARVVRDGKKYLIDKKGKIIDQTKRYTLLRATEPVDWEKKQ